MDKIKEYAKSIATFLATIGINMVISLLQGEQPFPHTQEEWIRYLGTAFTAALATGVARNKMTQGQIDTAKKKGEIVGDAVVVPTKVPAGTTPIVMTPDLPPASPVNPVAPASEPSVVDQIIAEKHRS